MNLTPDGLLPLADCALEFIQDGFVVGLGSGRTATAIVDALGRRVHEGLRIRAVPTSHATAAVAAHFNIPLTTLDAVEQLDVTIDGADEVENRTLNLIKGRGGALVREKVVAASSRRLVIVVTPDKLVDRLGQHGVLPVEVVPFALALARRRLALLGLAATLREEKGTTFVTDNGNNILDCQVGLIDNPVKLEHQILAIPGVVDTGLFLSMADVVLVQNDNTQVLTLKPVETEQGTRSGF